MRVQALRGFRDYLPRDMLAKDRMLKTVCEVFESFGYPPLQTPALEYSEILAGKYGEEGEMLMYRFRDHGDRDVCMRYDLTVPLARVVAEHRDLRMPFRRYQIAPVWRAEKPGKGRFREFMQCDVDLVGIDDAVADAEMILVDCAVLRALGVEGFQVRVNHRGLLRALTEGLELDASEETDFLRLLDKREKIGDDKFRSAVDERFGWSAERWKFVDGFLESAADPRATLASLGELFESREVAGAALERLGKVFDLIDSAGELDNVTVDPTIARGLSYYTGCIYETTLTALPSIGSVMSGGRYDELVGMFSGQPLAAVGISLGVDRLFSALCELGVVQAIETPARVLVVQFDEAGAQDAMRVAAAFRAGGISTLVYPSAVKLKKQYQYANAVGIRFTAVVGKDEATRGTVSLKDMETGEQTELKLEAAVEHLAATP